MIGHSGLTASELGGTWKFTVNTEATTAGEKTTGIPFNLYQQPGVVLNVNWGDGTKSRLTEADYLVDDSRASVHEYETAGTYQVSVKISGFKRAYILSLLNNFSSSTINNAIASLYWWKRTLVSVDNALPRLKGKNYYRTETSTSTLIKNSNLAACCFDGCRSLQSIPSGLFDKNTQVTSFGSCFAGCSSLTSIPEGLFKKNTLVTDFSYCFNSCTSLQSIPSGLFDKNTAVTTFNSCFYGCSSLQSIPSRLFDNNTAVTSFNNCFYGCSSLTSIPSKLFDNNTAVTSFSSCFRVCSSLTSIPSGLFDHNTAVTTFSDCFEGTHIQSIPSGLFANNIAVTNYNRCFNSDSLLQNVTLYIGSSIVSSCDIFVNKNTNYTRTIYVPDNSTTKTTFDAQASSLGLTILTYTPV